MQAESFWFGSNNPLKFASEGYLDPRTLTSNQGKKLSQLLGLDMQAGCGKAILHG